MNNTIAETKGPFFSKNKEKRKERPSRFMDIYAQVAVVALYCREWVLRLVREWVFRTQECLLCWYPQNHLRRQLSFVTNFLNLLIM